MKELQNGSDVRGVALAGVEGETVNLTDETVGRIAAAFGSWLSEKRGRELSQLKIAVGMDSRLSGPALKASVISALVNAGCEVLDCGLTSTPAMFMTTVHPDFVCDGSIMLTASHLPFNRNGLKFFTTEGGTEKKDISAILAAAESQPPVVAQKKGKCSEVDFISIYSQSFVEQVRKEVNAANYEQPLKGLNIIVDAGNGAGGFYAEKVLKQLGADTTGSQFLEPDGRFPNHVPNPENKVAMASICDAVRENQADFGIIFDTDVDRAAAVDSSGNEINRNRLIALISSIVLEEHPGSTVVTDSITSDGLAKFIEQTLGGTHHRFMRGYKNVINEAVRLNKEGEESWLAIETSGHAALKENYFLDDGAYLITKILVKLAKMNQQGLKLESLIAKLPEPVESEEFRLGIKTADFKAYGNKVIEDLIAFSRSESGWNIVPKNFEGLRVSCDAAHGNGWFLLRLSLHDPVIPLNVESDAQGGVHYIVSRLGKFFASYQELERKAVDSYLTSHH